MSTSPSAAIAATARSAGAITSGILLPNDVAGYKIFRHVAYQHRGLISPAHEKARSLTSRSGIARAIGDHPARGEPAPRRLEPPGIAVEALQPHSVIGGDAVIGLIVF
jgi:hypothetical protein